MEDCIREIRIREEAKLYVSGAFKMTDLAKEFELSKTQVHKDLRENLKQIDIPLFREVEKVANKHKTQRMVYANAIRLNKSDRRRGPYKKTRERQKGGQR